MREFGTSCREHHKQIISLCARTEKQLLLWSDWEASEMHVQVVGQKSDKFERSIQAYTSERTHQP